MLYWISMLMARIDRMQRRFEEAVDSHRFGCAEVLACLDNRAHAVKVAARAQAKAIEEFAAVADTMRAHFYSQHCMLRRAHAFPECEPLLPDIPVLPGLLCLVCFDAGCIVLGNALDTGDIYAKSTSCTKRGWGEPIITLRGEIAFISGTDVQRWLFRHDITVKYAISATETRICTPNGTISTLAETRICTPNGTISTVDDGVFYFWFYIHEPIHPPGTLYVLGFGGTILAQTTVE